jgi:replicative DNA helicase Mcm
MKCEVEEIPEGLRGKQPNRIPCELIGPLTTEERRIGGGDRVTIIGIYKAKEKAKGSLLYQGYIDVLGTLRKGKNFEDLVISPEDEKKYIEMSTDKDLLTKMSKSVAPNIHGHDVEKSAIVLQMAGGNLQAGDRRGNIHVLLIGDPGVGKSRMVANIVSIAPHVVQASGAPTTSVGLTACVKADENTPGGFILEAGAAVLADGGMLVVDEFDKMDKVVRGAMHEIMEDQHCTISKANINTTLNARCSVLAVMNPKRNRFNREEVIADQIDLPESMLSRFDLIFAIRDEVNEEEDRKKCKAILRARQGSEVITDYTKEDMTGYLAYVRSKINNITLSNEAAQLLEDRFVQIRNSNQGSDIIPITLRQMDGMVRLSEACAKLRLSSIVETQDAEVALGVITYYLDTMCMDSGTKKYEIDKLTGKEKKSEREARIGLRGFIENNLDVLQQNKNHWIRKDELKRMYLDQCGASSSDFEKALAELTDPKIDLLLCKEGDIYLEYRGDSKKSRCALDV